MRPLLLFSPLTLLLLAATAAGQYHYGYSQPSYSYPVYIEKPVYYKEVEYRDNYIPVATPVPFTVAVPVVSYLYNGSTFTPAFNAQAAFNSQGVQAYPPRSASSFQQAANSYQQQRAPNPTATYGGELSDAAIDRIIERIEARLAQRQQAGSANPPPVRADNRIIHILSTHCAACHTGSTAKKGMMILAAAGQLNPRADRNAIVDAVEDGRMPLGPDGKPHPLAAEEVEALKQWRDGR